MLILSSSLLGLWLYGFDLCYESNSVAVVVYDNTFLISKSFNEE